VGSAGGARKAALLVDELGLDGAVDYRAERVRDGLARVAPEGIDLYFDNVGGDHLIAALDALRLNGRVALCGMISQFDADTPRPSIDHLIQAVLKRLTLRGFIIRDHEDLRPEFERRVAGWLRTGELVAKQTVVDDLAHAVEAFLGMLRGANVGKMLVRLDPSVDA
jgi:NADPH-dependent curcumin reductase CurA